MLLLVGLLGNRVVQTKTQTNFEQSFIEEKLSAQKLQALECHCIWFSHLCPLQPEALDEESCVYFNAPFIAREQKKGAATAFKLWPLILS